ncbi:hypothetical protein [Bacillus sp. AFS023182]|uniref:hypothetical protein n=1 Tax=Bacillus sp. AFS023182 TaxID=2033492 RepID=UPI0009DF9968|nr:hypothetical protein [Bacillus sp. AFS023182]
MGKIKAETARSEWKGDGASDVEAIFASQEEAKPPSILADLQHRYRRFDTTYRPFFKIRKPAANNLY